MSNWFGKGCKYLTCTWEESEEVEGPDWRENSPELVYCNHPGNEDMFEGNCNEELCPLRLKKVSFNL